MPVSRARRWDVEQEITSRCESAIQQMSQIQGRSALASMPVRQNPRVIQTVTRRGAGAGME